MKRIILIASLLIAIGSSGFAQTAAAKDKKTKPKTARTSTTPATAPKTAAAAPKPAAAATAPKPATTAGPTKKDGTPDMRYKANKTPPPQHLKKDGTPDMRYKENKPKKTT